MTRNKVKLTYILNKTVRKTTFKKRRVGIVKKLDELTTLCGIEACAVIYSAFDPQPFVWPSMDEVRRLVTKHQSLPKVDQGKRKVNQETFTMQRLEKMQEKLRRQKRENRHNKTTQIMYQSMMDPHTAMSRLNMEDFKELARVISQNLMEVERRMEVRLRDSSSFNPPPPQFGAGGNGGGGSKQIVVSQGEFMPPNNEGFGSSMGSNMTYPPPMMEFPPPNMGFEPANMGFQPASMGFQHLPIDFPQNGMSYMDSNMGMPYPSNPSPFPYYHNNNIGPHDPSSH
ncbi:agamous-like MADS-box protein AGL80 [Impatiens glandulifera]|uniref:agamous-like MADS-box protein AGL80 n=1 Tax=Impatiens glandulifera TaxID=253017 RepID=UPI001FB10833|nr:agamous-like MADS-box protein AGL80 [Impatiens glandulifera]